MKIQTIFKGDNMPTKEMCEQKVKDTKAIIRDIRKDIQGEQRVELIIGLMYKIHSWGSRTLFDDGFEMEPPFSVFDYLELLPEEDQKLIFFNMDKVQVEVDALNGKYGQSVVPVPSATFSWMS